MGAASSGFHVRGEDAGAAIGNPATMTRLDSHQFNLGLAPGTPGCVLALLVRRAALPVPAPAAQVCAYGIGAVAAFWTIERVVGF